MKIKKNISVTTEKKSKRKKEADSFNNIDDTSEKGTDDSENQDEISEPMENIQNKITSC